MWPRFRKRGNPLDRLWLDQHDDRFNVAALSKARKSGCATAVAGDTLWLQCGRAFESAEMGFLERVKGGTLRLLQCGRAFESAEIRRLAWNRRPLCRFNVAALSKARKSADGHPIRLPSPGFNVAALSKARKSRAIIEAQSGLSCFNVAALSKARK